MAQQLSPTTLKILHILNDCKIHGGTAIAMSLGISRTAVWKVIQRLKKYSVDINSHHNGYSLNVPLILFDKKKIQRLINEPKIKLECFETIPSTSYYTNPKLNLKNMYVCLAEHQSKGRGRMNRAWSSPFGRNIYCSFSYLFNKDVSELAGLSLVVGILTAKMLEALDQRIKPFLKWPNDLYVNNEKMGGILIDLTAEAHGNCRATMGVGLNINMKTVTLKGVDQPWTSLEHILNEQLDRNFVAAQLIKTIYQGLEIFLENGLAPFLADWKRFDILENKKISINNGRETLSGIARGINAQGYLLLELPSGEIRSLSYGDTTLLKEKIN